MSLLAKPQNVQLIPGGQAAAEGAAEQIRLPAERAAQMVELAGEFMGHSVALRLATSEHLDGKRVTNGELILDVASSGGKLAFVRDDSSYNR